MFAPCACYKKHETGLVHVQCLKRLIEQHQVRSHRSLPAQQRPEPPPCGGCSVGPQQRNDTAASPRCPLCNAEFKGLRRRDIAWAALCSEKGFDVIFQFCTMCIMMVCCVFVGGLVIWDDSRPDDPEHPSAPPFTPCLSAASRPFSRGALGAFVALPWLPVLRMVETSENSPRDRKKRVRGPA